MSEGLSQIESSAGNARAIGEDDDDQQLLVSEYPPPPFYYTRAVELTPPTIPLNSFEIAAERSLLKEESTVSDAAHVPVQGGQAPVNIDNDVVGVFGEIVEDPCKVYENFVAKDEVDDPKVTYNKIKELNAAVLGRYIELVNDLVYRPKQNKESRDEVSENLMQMMVESNKFRSHQAREILIEVLESQLEKKKRVLKSLKSLVQETDTLL